MGFDTLEPFLEYAKPQVQALPKGFFVLLRTSNPGMIDIEKQQLASGDLVLDRVGHKLLSIEKEMKDHYIKQGCKEQDFTCSPVGAVVGCTEESDARVLRNTYSSIFFLIPGYGAQGGAARIAAILLDKAGGAVNSSRGILTAWKKDASLEFKRTSGKLSMNDIVNSAVSAAKEAKQDLLNTKQRLENSDLSV